MRSSTRLREHNPGLPLIDGTWPVHSHCAGSDTKAEYMEWTRGAIAELLRYGVIDT